MAGKTIYLATTPVEVMPGMTAGDLKSRAGAGENTRLSSWQKGTLRYWEDHQRPFHELVEGQKCVFRVLDGHPGYPPQDQ